MDPERARARLAEERARIEGELKEHQDPDTSGEPEDSGDEANDLEQAGTDGALSDDLRRTLEEIERAEERLENGTYGKSVVSGDPIPDGRLEAIPWADRTVDEEPGGRGRHPATPAAGTGRMADPLPVAQSKRTPFARSAASLD